MKNIFIGLLIVGIISACANPQPIPKPEPIFKPEPIPEPEPEPKPKPKPKPEPPIEEKKGECIESPDECANRWGIYLYPNGDCYQGYFKNAKKDGDGTLIQANGTKITTFWKNDETAGERAREIGRTMEMKFDPINLKQSCTDIINQVLFGTPDKAEPSSNDKEISLESCSGEDKFSKLLHKIATQLGRSCEIAESFLFSADSFISELQDNLSKLASSKTPVEKKPKLTTTILNYFENDQSCIELGENQICIPLQTLLSDLVAFGDTAHSIKLDFQGKNTLGEIEKLDDDLYQFPIAKWERFINCKQEDEACDISYSHRKFNIIFNNKLAWNMKVRTIALNKFLTEDEYTQYQE